MPSPSATARGAPEGIMLRWRGLADEFLAEGLTRGIVDRCEANHPGAFFLKYAACFI